MNFKDNLQLFYNDITMPAGYSFNTVNKLKQIMAFYDGVFLKGEKDNLGITKNFYNIIKSCCDVASKFIDLDTKDILFLSANGLQNRKIWLMQKDFNLWVKNSDFAQLLNEMRDHYPRGHIVLKKTKTGKWNRVPIVNMRTHPAITKLDNSPFVYEVLMMNKKDIEAMNWNGKEDMELLFLNEKILKINNNYLIYECYEKDGEKWKREFRGIKLEQVSGKDEIPENRILKNSTEELPYLVLHKDEMKELPYRELKWESKDGRWLGYGYPEYLIPNQIRRNEIKHLEKITMYLKALQVYLSNDDNIGDNVITDIQVGQILKTTGRLEQVKRDNVDISAYETDKRDWDMNTTRKTFDTDIARGDTLPSNTPLGLGQLQAQMTASYFDGKREDFGLFIKKLLYEDIIPSFKKDKKKRHNLMISHNEEDFDKFVDIVADGIINKEIKKSGKIPNLLEIETRKEVIRETFMKRGSVVFDVSDDFYDDVKVNVDIIITGESVNIQNRFNALMQAMQTLGGNPMILEDERTKRLFYKMLEMQGISSLELGNIENNLVNKFKQNEIDPTRQQNVSADKEQQSVR